MKSNTKFWGVVSLIVCVIGGDAICNQAYGAEVAANPHQTVSPDAFSKHDELLEIKLFNQRTLVEAYKEHGVKNTAWDKDAIEFLKLYTVLFTYSELYDEIYTHQALNDAAKQFRTTEQLVAALERSGCSDPLILYLIGVHYTDVGDIDASFDRLLKAYKGFAKTQYPAFRKLNSAWRLYVVAYTLDPKPAEFKDHQQWLDDLTRFSVDACREAANESTFSKRDYVVLTVDEIAQKSRTVLGHEKSLAFMKGLLNELETIKEGHGWAYHTAKGCVLKSLAWEYRGTGTGNTVTREGWQKFYEHLREGRDHLNAAWRIEPTVMVARTMITLTMADAGNRDQDVRYWFDRVNEMICDDMDAWSRMSYALWPRWGGSHEEMLAFALEAVNTGRFDTAVPELAIEILNQIQEETRRATYWRKQKTRGALDRLARGLDASPLRDYQPERWYTVLRTALMWRCSDFKRAKQALDQVGPLDEQAMHLAQKAFGLVRVDAREAIGEIHVRATKHGKVVNKANQQFWIGKWPESHKGFSDVLAHKEDLTPEAVHYLSVYVDKIEFLNTLTQGDWVRVDTPEYLELAWEQVHGQWALDEDGGLVGQADEEGLAIIFKHEIVGGWELACDVEVLSAKEQEWVNVGLVTTYQYRVKRNHDAFYVYPNTASGKTYFYRKWRDFEQAPEIKEGVNQLNIRQTEERQTIFSVNGKDCMDFSGADLWERNRFGLVSDARVLGPNRVVPEGFEKLKVRFSNIRIRTLTDWEQ